MIKRIAEGLVFGLILWGFIIGAMCIAYPPY